jgi:hypothetical protein
MATKTKHRKTSQKKESIMHEHSMGGLSILHRNLPNVSPGMTFPEMLLEQARLDKRIKLPPWLFPKICCRKNQALLTTTERQRYICASNMINADGTLAQLVTLHPGMYMQHGNLYLLPWHRIFYYFLKRRFTVIIPMYVFLIGIGTILINRSFPPGLLVCYR